MVLSYSHARLTEPLCFTSSETPSLSLAPPDSNPHRMQRMPATPHTARALTPCVCACVCPEETSHGLTILLLLPFCWARVPSRASLFMFSLFLLSSACYPAIPFRKQRPHRVLRDDASVPRTVVAILPFWLIDLALFFFSDERGGSAAHRGVHPPSPSLGPRSW